MHPALVGRARTWGCVSTPTFKLMRRDPLVLLTQQCPLLAREMQPPDVRSCVYRPRIGGCMHEQSYAPRKTGRFTRADIAHLPRSAALAFFSPPAPVHSCQTRPLSPTASSTWSRMPQRCVCATSQDTCTPYPSKCFAVSQRRSNEFENGRNKARLVLTLSNFPARRRMMGRKCANRRDA